MIPDDCIKPKEHFEEDKKRKRILYCSHQNVIYIDIYIYISIECNKHLFCAYIVLILILLLFFIIMFLDEI